LYELAHKWLHEDLKKQCLEYLKRSLGVENIVEIAKRAQDIGGEELEKAIVGFVMENENLLEEKEFEGIPHTILRKMICKSLVSLGKKNQEE